MMRSLLRLRAVPVHLPCLECTTGVRRVVRLEAEGHLEAQGRLEAVDRLEAEDRLEELDRLEAVVVDHLEAEGRLVVEVLELLPPLLLLNGGRNWSK